ncbi:haloacid dehalogenase [Psychromonas sp. psych-6C06]|uniref:HAD-IA family hydrolase n=1 Tax=Psychromonas sp. psych-6C06 TaxID=2058089 RepID=UPI000C34F37A|nr:HAD-IA family hydrolase [Psychromonas sp. psych-6C06]PKF61097.1 haloacid dehalogenase [Psychromonas sp. psych-6C06]
MRYKVIIFDWDGTLMDSIAKIVASLKGAAIECQVCEPTTAQIRHIIGLSLDKAMATLFPEQSKQTQRLLVDAYRQKYSVLTHIETPFYRGIKPWLLQLKAQGYLLAVATGKGRAGLDSLMDKFAVKDLFSTTYCADETASKPDPLMLTKILDDLNLNVSQALMVGDSSYDLAMANSVGMDCLAVSYGVHNKQILSQFKPIAIVDDLPKEFDLHVQ